MSKRVEYSKARHYRTLIERQQHSGLTIPQFCAKHRIRAWSFYYWRKRVSKGLLNAQAKAGSDPQPAQRFIPITIARGPVSDINSSVAEIVFEDSIRIKIPSDYPCSSIRAIVEALRYGGGTA